MGLIDTDKLIEDIHKRNYISKALSEIFETIIDEQPTAYDVDKVVEQLDKVCNDAESNPRKEAYLKALEDYHRLISEECKFMLIKYIPYALHLKEYNDKVLEQLKAGGNY